MAEKRSHKCGHPTADGGPCRFPVSNEGELCHQHRNDDPSVGGRPRKDFTDEQVKQIEKLASFMSQEQIADFFGVTSRTLRTRLKEDPELQTVYRKGRARAIAGVASGLLERALAGEPRATEFYLQTQGGWTKRRKVEHGGEIKGGDRHVHVYLPDNERDDDVPDAVHQRVSGNGADAS